MSYYAIEYSDHLSHHGILGQKWGDRNGPPYPLDSSSKSSSEKKASKSGMKSGYWTKQSIKNGKDKAPVSPAEKSLGSLKSGVESAQKGIDAISNISKRNTKTQDLSNLSDVDLARAIKRYQLETQYNAINSKSNDDGFETAKDILTIVGSTLSIALTAATLRALAKGASA